MGEQMDFWIVQNSWGDSWSDKGFVKVQRGTNLCKIASGAMYPVLKTAVPKTLKPITTPTICTKGKGDVFKDGVYVKSFCIENLWRNYEDSRVNCLINDMELYKLDTPEATSALLNYANKQFTAFSNASYFVDGKDQFGCKNINNIKNDEMFEAGTEACDGLTRSVCQYINISREFIF